MPVTKEYIDAVNAVLEPSCPLVCKDGAAISDLAHKIETYDKNLGHCPSPEMVCKWASVHEQRLQSAIDTENASVEAERANIAGRRQEVADYLSDATKDKEEMLKEARARQQKTERKPLTPKTNYSEKEMTAMSADEYKRKVLLGDNAPLDLNQSKPDNEMNEVRKKRILHSTNRGGSQADKQMRAALRRQIREGLL